MLPPWHGVPNRPVRSVDNESVLVLLQFDAETPELTRHAASESRMGLWAWLGRRHADEWLYRNRGQIAVIISLAVAGQLVALVLGLDPRWSWPSGWLPTVSITNQVEGLLATGTLALAFAALVQAVAGVEAIKARYRPSLVLVATGHLTFPNRTDVQPGLSGMQLGLRNLGPGVAKDARLTWFTYPDSTIAKKQIQDSGLELPATSVLGIYRTFVDANTEEEWRLEASQLYPVDMDYIIEVSASSVFDLAAHTHRYHARRTKTQDPRDPSKELWYWWIIPPPGGDEGRIPSIQDMIELARAMPPPYHWDMSH